MTGSPEFLALARGTSALTEYSNRMWSRHARALAQVIETETGLNAGDVRLRALTRYIVQVPSIVRDDPDRARAIDAVSSDPGQRSHRPW